MRLARRLCLVALVAQKRLFAHGPHRWRTVVVWIMGVVPVSYCVASARLVAIGAEKLHPVLFPH